MPGLKKYSFWRLYYGLVRLLDPFLVWVLRRQALGQPSQRRVRVVLYSQTDNQVLLVKNVVGSKNWSFPGGGVEGGESDQQAAARELEEELNLKVAAEDFIYLYTADPRDENSGVRQLAPVFLVAIDKSSLDISRYRKLEIMAVAWAAIDKLPADCSKLTRTTVSRLPEFAKLAKIDASRSTTEQAVYEKYI